MTPYYMSHECYVEAAKSVPSYLPKSVFRNFTCSGDMVASSS